MKSSAIKKIEQKTKANTPLSHYQLAELIELNPIKALQKLELLIKKNPKSVELWVMSGRAYKHLQKFTSAERFYTKALELNPHDSSALYYKAELMYLQEKYEDVECLIDHVISYLEVDEAIPLIVLLAFSLQKQKKYQQSIKEFSKLISLNEREWSYWNELGIIYQEIGQFDEMHKAYQQAKLLSEHSPIPYFNHIVSSHYDPSLSVEDIHQLCQKWQKKYKPIKKSMRAIANNKAKNKTLRIGMISDGFRTHPVGMMIAMGLSHVQQHEIEFYAYSTTSVSDHITQRIQRITSKWTQVENITDSQLDVLLREHEIDILFDLNGYNANSRMQTLQLKPAPIMIKWVGGLISSTGLDGMDYLLSDNIETPEGVDSHYSEKLIRLPVDYICYDPPAYLPPVKALPCEIKGFITFGCFNNAAKINDDLLEQWAILLNEVPDSQLYLKSFNFKDESLCERIYITLGNHGIKRDRIILEGASPHKELLESYNHVDIALDPWPYSGGLTTCEAMVMGVPVITLPGPTFAGRHSASHLVHAGMPELVAKDWEDYRKIAKELANDSENLALIRCHLREILLSSPVCDGKRFARHFSDAMRAVWQRYAENKLPESLSFDENEGVYFKGEECSVILNRPLKMDTSPFCDNESGFSFNLDGQVKALDYGGILARQDKFKAMMAMNGTFMIIIDPLGMVEDHYLPLKRNSLQKIQMQLLGDGNDAQLYMCLDAKYSSDLPAISVTSQQEWYPQKVLASIKAPSLKLDEIHGLDNVDWLILDNRFNLGLLFAHGVRVLKSCLFVAVYYRFEDTHEGQLPFSEICMHLKNAGLDFHSFINIEYAQTVGLEGVEPFASSQMIAAEAIFIVTSSRRNNLSAQQCEKLAFILHSGYGLYDVVAPLLQLHSTKRLENYLKEIAFDKTVPVLRVNKNKTHSLPQKLIVSLTSYDKRFSILHLTLDCIFKQTVKADRVILWVAESEKGLLPENVLAFKEYGLEIKACEDLKSYKKIIPLLKEDSNSFIVTADDDLYYPENWLNDLIDAWNGDYRTVVAHRAHKILLNQDGMPVPYSKWEWEYNLSTDVSSLIFPTSGAGVLYPPHCFYRDVINEKLFSKLSPGTDDVWLYWMCLMNGVKFKVVGKKMELLEWVGITEKPLWHENLLNGGNDNNINKMIAHYGFKINDDEQGYDGSFGDIFSFSCENQLVHMHLPNKNDYIQNVIKSSGGFYEPEMLLDISNRVRKGSTILDVGANIGNHSLYFSLFCGANKVISFEPQKNVYDTLCKNIKLNFLEKMVVAYQIGLGSYETTANLGEVDEKNISMTRLDINSSGDVRISTLDSVVEKEPLNSISVIKLDVEGMEMEVLRGAIQTFERHQPVLYVEAASKKEFDEVSAFLLSFNYIPTRRFNATATYLFEKKI
ncbi:FkbM family methyltransferase [Pantoea dispersa]|uniref:FkbM family methyltransferase n=1 Tax=Pantoea dispersa TaxID=59814 RepID=UPI000FDC316C|nr:FkbM family methyltransferase [Pantoea dispersa]RVU75287.1 FkbM family methyltransferase [Pantoea dispersa]